MNKVTPKTFRLARVAQIAIMLMALPILLLYPASVIAAYEIAGQAGAPQMALPFAVAACIAVLAAHVFLLSVWKIAGFIKTGSFYNLPVLRWVNVAKGATVAGCLMPILVGGYLLIAENTGGALMIPFLFGAITAAIAAGALLDLLSSLYQDASSNVAELAEVI